MSCHQHVGALSTRLLPTTGSRWKDLNEASGVTMNSWCKIKRSQTEMDPCLKPRALNIFAFRCIVAMLQPVGRIKWGAITGWWGAGSGPWSACRPLPRELVAYVFQLATACDEETVLPDARTVASQLMAYASVSRACRAACQLVPVDVGIQFQQLTGALATWLCSQPVRTLVQTADEVLVDANFYDVLQPAKTAALQALVGPRFFELSAPCLERLVGFYQAQQLSSLPKGLGWVGCLARRCQLSVIRLDCHGTSFDSSCLSSLRRLRELDLKNVTMEDSRLQLLPTSLTRLTLGPMRRHLQPFSLGAVHLSELVVVRVGHLRLSVPALVRLADEVYIQAELPQLSIGEYASKQQLLENAPEDLAAALGGSFVLSFLAKWGAGFVLLHPDSAAAEASVPCGDFLDHVQKFAWHVLSIDGDVDTLCEDWGPHCRVMRATVPFWLQYCASDPMVMEEAAYLSSGPGPVAGIEWAASVSGLPALQRQVLHSSSFQRSSAACLQELEGLQLEYAPSEPLQLSCFSGLTRISGRLQGTSCSTAAVSGSDAPACAVLPPKLKQLSLQPADGREDSRFSSAQLQGLSHLRLDSLTLSQFKTLDLIALPARLTELHLRMESSSWHLTKGTLAGLQRPPPIEKIVLEAAPPCQGGLACLIVELQPWLLHAGQLTMKADVVDVVYPGPELVDLARLLWGSRCSLHIEGVNLSFIAAGGQERAGCSASPQVLPSACKDPGLCGLDEAGPQPQKLQRRLQKNGAPAGRSSSSSTRQQQAWPRYSARELERHVTNS